MKIRSATAAALAASAYAVVPAGPGDGGYYGAYYDSYVAPRPVYVAPPVIVSPGYGRGYGYRRSPWVWR